MTNEERDIITQFIARVGGTQQQSGSGFAGSDPATTQQPALPPVDREADAFIAQLFQRYPEARYRITQLAFVQEHALVEAQNRLRRLEWELQQAQQSAQQAQQQRGSGGGFFSGLFGGGRSQSAPPPQWGSQGGPSPGLNQGTAPPPQYAPNYQPGMFQRSGSGFLGSALTTAAGVAGGVVAGNALMNLFSGQHGLGAGYGGGFAPGAGASGPWGAPPAGAETYTDQGTWDTSAGGGVANQDYTDSGTWDQPTDTSSDPSGGWSDNSGGWDTSGGGGSDDDSLV
ncbi:MAG: DUF2076 domain-containing protein [Acetobacteraceae bacterium]|nr:DUF2076 domain-containing protein [Acetobacteraceae bacterium]